MTRKLHIKPNRSLTNLQILFFLFITGFLIIFIGGRFLLVGAWPIIIFGIVEFSILVVCSLSESNSTTQTQTPDTTDTDHTCSLVERAAPVLILRHHVARFLVGDNRPSMGRHMWLPPSFLPGLRHVGHRRYEGDGEANKEQDGHPDRHCSAVCSIALFGIRCRQDSQYVTCERPHTSRRHIVARRLVLELVLFHVQC